MTAPPALRRLLAATRAALLLLVAACAAPEPPLPPLPPLPPAPLPARPELPFGAGLLWQIEKDGQQPSYVFGTMHVPDPEFLNLPSPVQAAFDLSRHVAVEVVAEKGKEIAYLTRYVTAVLLPEGQSLSDLLSDEAYTQLLQLAWHQTPPRVNLGSLHISRFKPWFVMEVVGPNDVTASHLDSSRPVLDAMLEQRARETGKSVSGLETFEEHLVIDSGIPLDDQAALLTGYLANRGNWQNYAAFANAYRNGDTAMLHGFWQQSLLAVEPGLARRYTARFLDDRNRLMVERALPLMAKGATFVAVGAAHLPGEVGILRLLEQRGYTVTRLY
ncbi:MAG: TraB/GumN family protein [Bacteroidota bacterium]|nr:TraB/GumN family protein [Kiloniellaceae bacterium]